MTASADTLAREIADLRRRLEALERTAQMAHTSVEGGALIVNDDTGLPVLTVGRQQDGAYAVAALEGGKVIANTLDLPEGSITETDIAPGAISTPKLAANAVTADKIQAGAITSAKISADAIDGRVITGVKINAGELLAADVDGSYVYVYDENPGDGAVVELGVPTAAGTVRIPARLRVGSGQRLGGHGIELRGPTVDGVGGSSLVLGGQPGFTNGDYIEIDTSYLMAFLPDGMHVDLSEGAGTFLVTTPPTETDPVTALEVNPDGTVFVRALQINGQRSQSVISGALNISFASRNSHTQEISFPAGTQFTAAPRVMTNIRSTAAVTAGWISRAFNVTATGFTLYVGNVNGTAVAWPSTAIDWIAVSAN